MTEGVSVDAVEGFRALVLETRMEPICLTVARASSASLVVIPVLLF